MTTDGAGRNKSLAPSPATPSQPPAPPSATSRLIERTAPGLAIVTILLLLAVVFVAARSINYVSPNRPGPDAGVFATVGMQINDGKSLYRDTMDAKPPVVYLLNAAALSLGDGTFHSVRILERVFAVVGSLLMFFLVWTIYGRRSLATLAALGYVLLVYSDILFEEGNVTEEYAIVFLHGAPREPCTGCPRERKRWRIPR